MEQQGMMLISTPVRNILIIGLLLAGALLVYLSEIAPTLLGQQAAARGDVYTYIADLDFWQRTHRERTVLATARFDLAANLEDVPLTVGDWVGEDVPETNEEVMILLDPEQYVQRLYFNSTGQHLWLSLIGGRSSQPFHAPDICYDADGWQYNLGSHTISLTEGGDVYGLWIEAKKQLPGDDHITEQIAYYFYLFPDERRTLNDGIVLFKVTSARYGTVEETLAIQADFVRQLFARAL
jgi:hypothetical protein